MGILRTDWYAPPTEQIFVDRDLAGRWENLDTHGDSISHMLLQAGTEECYSAPRRKRTSHEMASPATAEMPLSQSHASVSMHASTPACFGMLWAA
jgi:hypothetical protein